jgi:hypothetical protein
MGLAQAARKLISPDQLTRGLLMMTTYASDENRSDLQKKLVDFERRLTKDKVRFAVGRPGGHYSGVWAHWGNKSDFYIGARSILGSMKISLHKSGICRVALTDRHFAALTQKGRLVPNDRAFVKWERLFAPDEGAHLAAVLVFPTDFLRLEAPVGTAKKPLLLIESASPGKAVEIGYFYCREARQTLESKFLAIGKPLVFTDLENGEVVWMVAREAEFDPACLPSSEQLGRSDGNVLEPNAFPVPGVPRTDLNAVLWNAPQRGEALRMIEIGGVTAVRNNSEGR